MKIRIIGFQKTIGMPNFSNDRPIVVEADLEEGETEKEAWSKMNKAATEWHREEYPHLYQNTQKELQTTWQDETRADEFDQELAKEILALKGIEFREDAEEYLSRENWRKYNPTLKSLVNAKPPRPVSID